MAYIYKITNDINQKIYIGQTVKSLKERFRTHIKDSFYYPDRPLYRAFKKYGIEHFSIEMLEECNLSEVDEREIYWIELFGSFKYGYNATKGGEGKPYADYDLIYALWNEGKNIKQIHEITNYDEKTVRTALNNFNVSKEQRKQKAIQSMFKSIAMLDKDSEEIIQVFPSIAKAYRFLGKQHSGHIASVCLKKRKTAYGYKWKYID